jgi:hypothetical protein
MKTLAKLDPQPDAHGIFSAASIFSDFLSPEGRRIHFRDWDEKERSPEGKVLCGVWLAELHKEPDGSGYLTPGKFSQAPPSVSFYDLFEKKVEAMKINDEWWWVKK